MTDNNNNIENYKKMSDKEFYLKLSLSLISIIGCVGMMISSALALFVSEAKSTGNVIKAGDFDVIVTSSCGCLENASASFIASCGAKDHTFTIEPSGTVDGFVKFIIEGNGNSIVRYTEQMSFPITVTIGAVNGTVIRFQPFWGRVENVNYSRLPLVSDYDYIFHSEKEETTEDGENSTEETENIESDASDSVAEEGADSSEDTQPPTDDNSDTGSEDIVDNSSDTDSNVEDSGLSDNSNDNSNDIADDSSEPAEISDDVPVDDSAESEELSDDAPADDESVAE